MSNIVFLFVCMFFIHVWWIHSSPLPHREEVSGREPKAEDIFLDVDHQTENAAEAKAASEHDAVVWEGGKPEPKQREKDDETKTKPPGCHREDMFVDFANLGWKDWVLVPTSYNAYRCAGKCTLQERATNHAVMELMMRSHMTSGAADHHGPCCTPTKLGPLSMLTLENSRVVLKSYTDMVVEECRCQ